MKRRLSFLFPAIVLLATLAAAVSRADDKEDCLTLSFAPLLQTIPACDRLIAAGGLGDADLIVALMARADALRFALTYRSGQKVKREDLLTARLGDLDRAVGLARRLRLETPAVEVLRGALSERAVAEAALGHHARAVGDYSEAIALADTPALLDLYGRSLAYERSGRLDQAIADMSAILRIHSTDSNFANHLVRRAELHEAAGDKAAAITDYRRALKESPDHTGARQALEKLQAAE